MRKKYFCSLVVLILSSSQTAWGVPLAEYFNFEGQLLNDAGEPISPPATIEVSVFGPAETCLLYRETHTLDANKLDQDGYFSIRVGPGDTSGTRVSASVDGGLQWPQIWQNNFVVRNSGSTNCSAGYTPASGDTRKVVVRVNGTPLSPSFTVSSVPFATTAQSLQGLLPSQLVRAPTTAGTSGQVLTAGATAGETVWVTAAGTGTVTSVATGAGLTGGPITTTGTLDLAPTAVSPGTYGTTLQIPQLTIDNYGRTTAAIQQAIPFATNSQDGILSSTDYNTFAAKVTSIVSSPLTSGSIWIGNASLASEIPVSTHFQTSGTFSIATNAITTNEIDNNAVTNSKIQDGSITSAKLATGAVTDAAINTGALSFDRLNSSSCTIDQVIKFSGSTLMCDSPYPMEPIFTGDNNTGPLDIGVSSGDINLRTGFTTQMVITSAGNVGIGTMTPSELLHVVGNLRVQGTTDCTLGNGSGGTSCSSDSRLKDQVTPISDSVEKIQALRGVEFVWNDKSRSPGQSAIGVIAQEVEAIFPTLVITDKDTGFKRVDYAGLVSPLIEAVKSLAQDKVELNATIETQQRQIQSLEERLLKLEEKMGGQ